MKRALYIVAGGGADMHSAMAARGATVERRVTTGSVTETPLERLRRLHVRVTPQRLLVLEALMAHGGHVTADEILRWAGERYPALNIATVYRTLDVLTSAGVASQTDLGGGASQFELVGDAPHHHLVCERCGSVTEIDDAMLVPLRETLLQEYGFLALSRHVALFGLCERCREEETAPTGPTTADK